MIRILKYSADWKLVRNGFKMRRCEETDERIWPLQKVHLGLSMYQYPPRTYRIKLDAYLVLKLKGEI